MPRLASSSVLTVDTSCGRLLPSRSSLHTTSVSPLRIQSSASARGRFGIRVKSCHSAQPASCCQLQRTWLQRLGQLLHFQKIPAKSSDVLSSVWAEAGDVFPCDWISVSDQAFEDVGQIDTDSPMGRAMFTIVGAMAELESSLISERVSAGMKAAAARGKHLGRPPLAPGLVKEIKMLAASTNLSIREIHKKIGRKASRGRVGEITKQTRSVAR